MPRSRFAAVAERAEMIDGYARTLEPVSSASRWRLMQDIADDVVKVSVDAGAYFSVWGAAGPVIDMQDAYDGGGVLGAGTGRSVTSMTGAVVFTNSAANGNNVLELTKSPAGAQTGTVLVIAATPGASAALNGMSVTSGANSSSSAYAGTFDWRGTAGTIAGSGVVRIIDTSLAGNLTGPLTGLVIDVSSAFHNGQVVQGMSIIGPATNVAAATKQATLLIQARHSLMRALSMSVRNKQAGTDGVIYVEWDTTNFEGAVASSILTGETNMVVLNGQANVDALTNNVLFRGAWILVPATTNVTTRGVFVDSLQRGGSVFEAAVSPGVASVVNGYLATMGANTTGAAFLASATSGVAFQAALAPLATNAVIGFDYDRTGAPTAATTYTGNAINIQNTPTGTNNYNESGTLVLINHAPIAGAGTITDTTRGLSITMTPAAASAVIGIVVTMGANTSSAGYAGKFDWRGTAGTAAGNGIVNIEVGASTTLTGPLTGLEIDLSSTSGAVAVTGIAIATGTATSGNAIAVTMSSTSPSIGINVAASGSFGTTLGELAKLTYSGSLLRTIPVLSLVRSGFWGDGGGSDTANYLSVSFAPTTAATSTFSGAVASFSHSPTIGSSHTSSCAVVRISHTPTFSSGTHTDTTTGLAITMTPANLAAAVNGVVVTMGALTSSAGYAAKFDWRGTAGTASGNGIVNIEVGASTTFTGPLTGLSINWSTSGNLQGSQQYRGVSVSLPQTPSSTSAAIYTTNSTNIFGGGTYSYSHILIEHNGLTDGGGGPPVDSIKGLTVTMAPALASSTTNGGIVVTMGANTSSAGYAGKFDWRGTAGTAAGNGIVNIEVGAATVLAGQLVGIECDFKTNVTPGANAFIGQRFLIPATTRANRSDEAVIYIESAATEMRMIQLRVLNTSANNGGLISVLWDSATTLTGTTRMLTLDGASNVSGGGQVFQGVYVSTPANLNNTDSYVARFDWRGTAGTAAGTGIVNIEIGTVTVFTGQLVGIEVDLSTNHTLTNNVATIGQRILIPATTRANTAGEGAFVISSDATLMRALDIDVALTRDAAIHLRWGSATTIAMNQELIGYNVDFANVTGNAGESAFAFSVSMPSTLTSTCLVRGFSFTSVADANTTGARFNIAPTTTGSSAIGTEVILGSNVTGSGFGSAVSVGATGGSSSTTGFYFTRSGSPGAVSVFTGRAIEIQNTPTGTNNYSESSAGLVTINHAPIAGAGTITDTTVGLTITMTPAASSAVIGQKVVMGALTSNAGYAALFAWRGTAGTAVGNAIVNIEIDSTTEFTAQIVGLEIDLATNHTLTNNVATIGQRISIPATTAVAANLQAALVISSDATLARVFDIDVANKEGSIFVMRYGTSVTRTAALIGLDLDLQANGGTANFSVTGIRVRTPTGMATPGNRIAFDIDGQINWTTGGDGAAHLAGPTDTDFLVKAGTAAQVAATTVGRAVNLTASNAVAGASVSGAAAGGPVYINGGNAARLTSGDANGGAIELNPGAGIGTGVAGGVLVGVTNPTFMQFYEMTAPAAPGANSVRLYSRDNGAGKTQLMAIFPSGAAQQVAIEP